MPPLLLTTELSSYKLRYPPKTNIVTALLPNSRARAAEDASYVISQQRGVDRGTEHTARQVDQKRGERRQRHRLEDVLTSSLS